jgi:hypothetical protein
MGKLENTHQTWFHWVKSRFFVLLETIINATIEVLGVSYATFI